MADSESTAIGAGAASGAVAGTAIMPGWGTLIGAGVGAASGYLGAQGAKKRRKAQARARQQYQAALAQYQQQELARNAQREALLNRQSQQANTNFQTYMGQKPGDQSASLQQDAADQASALYAAQAPTPALAGPLAGQYQAEMNQRVGNDVNSMALDYSTSKQDFAGDANNRDYETATSALSRERNLFEQQAGVGSALSNRDRAIAEANYGVDRARAQNAGSEQMMYGGFANSALQLANAYGSAQRQANLRNEAYGNPALTPSDNANSWNSRNPALRNPYDSVQA
jgi:hypothetical protein